MNIISNPEAKYTEPTEEKFIYDEVAIKEQAGFVSRLFFMWTNTILEWGLKENFSEKNLFKLDSVQDYNYSTREYEEIFQKHKHTKDFLRPTLIKHNKSLIFLFVSFSMLNFMSQFVGPLLLGEILSYVKEEFPTPEEKTRVYIIGVCITFSYFVKSLFQQHGLEFNNDASFRIQAALSDQIFKKVLRISSISKSKMDSGKIIQHANVDTQQIFFACQLISFVFTSPVIIIFCSLFICLQVGWIGIIGVVIALLGTMLNGYVTIIFFKKKGEAFVLSDQRAKFLTETIAGARIVKYFGWENMILNKIDKIRNLESDFTFKLFQMRGLIDILTQILTQVISLVVFSIYVHQGQEFNPSVAFTLIALFQILQTPTRMISVAWNSYKTAMLSIGRIQTFIDLPDKKPLFEDQNLQIGQIKCENASFSWEENQVDKKIIITQNKDKKNDVEMLSLKESQNKIQPEIQVSNCLKKINFDIKPGQFVGIVGQVGSGKTSLLNGILQEMNQTEGYNSFNGRIAYLPQTAWLQNQTIRDNILFQTPYEKDRYENCLKICELLDDIKILEGGDKTEIGERGINLSGGQKQRVSIARAVYSDSDIVLMDDCLSAVDAHVGQKLYKNVVTGILKGKTVVLVSHAIHFLTQCDTILVMKDGEIVEQGTYQELLALKGHFNLLSQITSDKEEKNDRKESLEVAEKVEKKIDVKNDVEKGQLVKKEEITKGNIKARVYKQFIQAGGGFFFFMVMLTFLISASITFFADLWVSIWSGYQYDLEDNDYIFWFAMIIILGVVMILLRAVMLGKFQQNLTNSLFKRMMFSILRSPLSWFDTTPSGRILNRTNKDQDELDNALAFNLSILLNFGAQLITTLITVFFVLPFILIPVVFISIYLIYINRRYLYAAQNFKRVQGANAYFILYSSPYLNTINEAINGYVVIRAYRKEKIYIQTFSQRFQRYQTAFSNTFQLNRWMSLRTDFVLAGFVGFVSFFGIFSREMNYTNNQGLIAMAIARSFGVTFFISLLLKFLSDFDLNMNAVERILDYIHKDTVEASWEEPKPKENWPQRGNYEAENVRFKYRPELPEVIKGIDFKIGANEKVGVVGRTGSGKSTLTLGLLRMLELSEEENTGKTGSIQLGEADISKLGLHHIRGQACIIPQDPYMFSGNIRQNIDPFAEFGNQEIIEALKKTQILHQLTQPENIKLTKLQQLLKKYGRSELNKTLNEIDDSSYQVLSDDEKKLYMEIEDNGQNISLGQRQLICMARALVRKCPVLIMDEATANIDELNDHLIQTMIKKEFKDTTVITIAHRLNTIINYDRIMVMQEGNIVEFEHPKKLMQDSGSQFHQMVKQNGQDFFDKLMNAID